MEDDRPRRRHARTSQTPRWILLSTIDRYHFFPFHLVSSFYQVGWGRSRSSWLTVVRVVVELLAAFIGSPTNLLFKLVPKHYQHRGRTLSSARMLSFFSLCSRFGVTA